MKLVNANVDLMQILMITDNVGVIINASFNAKSGLIKVYCECECDKLCDVGEYLDYENCKIN